ncbi:MAG TPA: hypothetical protein VMF91_06785 [Bryobacteraceae bacterium]|nr:hypothetical protein [Bryobacteraceae bacterium]
MRTGPVGKPDPSVLVIDEFITEEQESKILQDLADSVQRRFARPRFPMLLRCLLLPGG